MRRACKNNAKFEGNELMARSGSFSGPTEEYGLPLSVVKTNDNALPPRFHPLIEALTGFTDEEKAELQNKLDEGFGIIELINGLGNRST
jgi:hypothetical protein